MTANGQPDNPRAARYVLKDYMNGKLLYCHPPPGIDADVYQIWPERQKFSSENRVLPPRQMRAIKVNILVGVFSRVGGVEIIGA